MTTEDKIEQALIVCRLWGEGNWESWSKERLEGFTANFKHSPNFQEAKASILKLIEPKDVTGTYYDSGEGR